MAISIGIGNSLPLWLRMILQEPLRMVTSFLNQLEKSIGETIE